MGSIVDIRTRRTAEQAKPAMTQPNHPATPSTVPRDEIEHELERGHWATAFLDRRSFHFDEE